MFENTLALDAERDPSRSDAVCRKSKYYITAAAWWNPINAADGQVIFLHVAEPKSIYHSLISL